MYLYTNNKYQNYSRNCITTLLSYVRLQYSTQFKVLISLKIVGLYKIGLKLGYNIPTLQKYDLLQILLISIISELNS